MHGRYQPKTPLGRAVSAIEENAMAVILGAMVLTTFWNVVERKLWGGSLLSGLEVTSALFAWLVLLGMSHAVKTTAHLGVDAASIFFRARSGASWR